MPEVVVAAAIEHDLPAGQGGGHDVLGVVHHVGGVGFAVGGALGHRAEGVEDLVDHGHRRAAGLRQKDTGRHEPAEPGPLLVDVAAVVEVDVDLERVVVAGLAHLGVDRPEDLLALVVELGLLEARAEEGDVRLAVDPITAQHGPAGLGLEPGRGLVDPAADGAVLVDAAVFGVGRQDVEGVELIAGALVGAIDLGAPHGNGRSPRARRRAGGAGTTGRLGRRARRLLQDLDERTQRIEGNVAPGQAQRQQQQPGGEAARHGEILP
ncbi:hypothetical protein D3C72_1153260 [compost metagenome]